MEKFKIKEWEMNTGGHLAGTVMLIMQFSKVKPGTLFPLPQEIVKAFNRVHLVFHRLLSLSLSFSMLQSGWIFSVLEEVSSSSLYKLREFPPSFPFLFHWSHFSSSLKDLLKY